jgi:hypothetical protein
VKGEVFGVLEVCEFGSESTGTQKGSDVQMLKWEVVEEEAADAFVCRRVVVSECKKEGDPTRRDSVAKVKRVFIV